jgi:hypothetical protein
MTTPGDGFDPVAIVIDWLDACKGRRLDDLLDLYDDTATMECACVGATLRGRQGLEQYWAPRLAGSQPDAFRMNDVVPAGADVVLDYQSHEGQPVRIYFQFDESGKILHTRCYPRTGTRGPWQSI